MYLILFHSDNNKFWHTSRDKTNVYFPLIFFNIVCPKLYQYRLLSHLACHTTTPGMTFTSCKQQTSSLHRPGKLLKCDIFIGLMTDSGRKRADLSKYCICLVC